VKSNYSIIDVVREAWNEYVEGKELARRDFGAGFRDFTTGIGLARYQKYTSWRCKL
jgi:hypothetical protein